MNLSDKQVYRFADIEVDPARGCLLRDGNEKHLRKKAFQVLVYLIERRERLVSKAELFDSVWMNTAVTDDVLVQCVTEIRRVIGDDSHRPQFIKTVPKAGYRFIGNIAEQKNGASPARLAAETVPRPVPAKSSGIPLNSQYIWLPATLLLVFTVAAVVYLAWPSAPNAEAQLPQLEGKTTVAVMFFENQSRDAELDWLREGLADMLINNLSGSEKLTVLSRYQFHTQLERIGYKTGDRVSLDTGLSIARKSGAGTLLAGTFARLGEKVRLDVRLLDAETGEVRSAESLTVDRLEQILTDIDLLSLRLRGRLGVGSRDNSPPLASAMTNNLEAYRCYSLALEKAQGLNKTEALNLFQKAVELDPGFAMAHARIGHTYAVTWGWAEQAQPHLARAFELSDRLTEKDRLYILAWYAIAKLDYPGAIGHFRNLIAKYPAETEAYLRLGYLLRGEELADEAAAVLRQGLAVDPESAAHYNALGLLYSEQGKHGDAIAMHERYVALAPNEPNAFDSLGMSLQWAGRYPEAIEAYGKALALNPAFEIANAHMGVAQSQMGKYRTALEYFDKYRKVAPSKLESARGHTYSAHVYRKRGDLKNALSAARRALAENSIEGSQALVLALDSGDRNTARRLESQFFAETKITNRGSRGSPRRSLYFRGYIALRLDRPDEAIEIFKTALQHPPFTWDIDAFEDCLANAYLETGRFDEAIDEYNRVLRLNPNYPLAHFNLARAYQVKGQTIEARENYLAFLEVWKDADADIPEIKSARAFLNS